MALTTCNRCGKQVSDRAKACPNCGAPIVVQKATNIPPNNGNVGSKSNVPVITCSIIVIVFVFAIGMGIWIFNSGWHIFEWKSKKGYTEQYVLNESYKTGYEWGLKFAPYMNPKDAVKLKDAIKIDLFGEVVSSEDQRVWGECCSELARGYTDGANARNNANYKSNNSNVNVPPSIEDLRQMIIANPRSHDVIEQWSNILSDHRLTEDDIWGIDSSTLRFLRNAIFARHNYRFKSQDLMDFFMEYSWYYPEKNNVISELNSTETYNIDFFKRHE